jgi:hypothetical protein
MIRRHGLRLIICTLLSSLFFSFLLITFNSVHAGGVLPDTGQKKCYNLTGEIPCPAQGEPFYGQDGNYQGPQPAYEVSADGLVVTDLRTGLMWQQADDGVKRDWGYSSTYCENLVLGGNSDWRIPSRQELVSIVDYGRYSPSINPTFSCQSTYYWSGSTLSDVPGGYFWVVSFGNGHTMNQQQANSLYVRCVRGGP